MIKNIPALIAIDPKIALIPARTSKVAIQMANIKVAAFARLA